jgi:hypothetical protein
MIERLTDFLIDIGRSRDWKKFKKSACGLVDFVQSSGKKGYNHVFTYDGHDWRVTIEQLPKKRN